MIILLIIKLAFCFNFIMEIHLASILMNKTIQNNEYSFELSSSLSNNHLGHKISLIIKSNEKDKLGLSSNEFKKASVRTKTKSSKQMVPFNVIYKNLNKNIAFPFVTTMDWID
ncbi:unnamed protein product [Cunninghamella blakesleeana]